MEPLDYDYPISYPALYWVWAVLFVAICICIAVFCSDSYGPFYNAVLILTIITLFLFWLDTCVSGCCMADGWCAGAIIYLAIASLIVLVLTLFGKKK